jgi:predicted acyltransferase
MSKSSPAKTETSASRRIASLDQYRGFAIFGMLVVNHLGEFACMPEQFRHHRDYMTFADIIAPLFMFVVGMGFRLSLQRRVEQDGARTAYIGAVKRYLALVCVGIVLYDPSPDQWRYWWDALVDIGFGAILALPFMMRSTTVRAAAGAGYWILYQAIFRFTAYGAWTMDKSIDGGPVGPLSWAPIVLFGTIAYDLIATRDKKTVVNGFLTWGLALSVIGVLFYFPLPGIKERWLFSQTSMEIPYPVLATGICFLLYLPFYFLNDVIKVNIPTLALVGMNPLILYILQNALGDMYGPSLIVAEDAAWPMALVDFAFMYGCCYIVAWKLNKDRVIIKL